jgi:diguanylate cyclase (GGDEF)-like protein
MKKTFIHKHLFLFSNLAIIFFIVSGFICVVYRDTKTYQNLAKKDLKNIVSLADLNIEKFIETTMSKPVTVSKTMANDAFLKSWMLSEDNYKIGDSYFTRLYDYLKAYQQKYGYSTVFCISAKTGRYYYQGGLNKTVSPYDPHDIWYYNFIKSGHEYDLEVDTSQADGDSITIFVNFRIEKADGTLLGIIGVGLQVDFLENLIRFYEKDYDLSVYIINSSGVKTSFTGKTNNFINQNDLEKLVGMSDTVVLRKSEDAHIQWFTAGNELKCLITRYNATLCWYLIVEKDTATISNAFQERIRRNILFMLFSLTACIAVTTIIFIFYNQRIIEHENRDEITGLPNRKLFSRVCPSFIRKHKEYPQTLFMFDIDKFKDINDTYGHIFGNAILTMVGESLCKIIPDYGITARWGGDEFIGILALDTEEARELLNRLMAELKSRKDDSRYHVTISVGLVKINHKRTIEQISRLADASLYYSKKNGRNQITVCNFD